MQSKAASTAGFMVGLIRSMFNVRTSYIFGAAGLAAVVVGLIFALYEVQGWKMPVPLAVFLLTILFLMLFVALVVICFEIINGVRKFFDERATSASWVSKEAPGLLDYEADGEYAAKRFTEELLKLTKDTKELGATITKYSVEFENLNKSGKTNKGIDKQKKANKVAKSYDRSAIYIEKRAELFNALVKDIARNYNGVITVAVMHTEEDRMAAQNLLNALVLNEESTSKAIYNVQQYRDTVRDFERKNFSRTIRIASARLGDGLDSLLKTLRLYVQNSSHMRANLERKLLISRC